MLNVARYRFCMSKPEIAVTMGDPAGVGPELCLHLLANEDIGRICEPLIFGDLCVLNAVAGKTGLTKPLSERVRNFAAISMDDFQPGTVSAATGRAGYTYVEESIKAALAGKVTGVVTAPLNKEALCDAGVPYPGHTEIFADQAGAGRFCMLQYSDAVTCSFVTVHVGYYEVPILITSERIFEVIELTRDALLRIRNREPKLVVLGLNPHAGERGLFGGKEEERFIIPAIEKARGQGWDMEGPIPPDTAFIPNKRAETDAFICMYHDQGHIPLKALAFDTAVNTTLGLPFPRTSVDHGTALDIAWQGKASPSSLFEAVKLNVLLGEK